MLRTLASTIIGSAIVLAIAFVFAGPRPVVAGECRGQIVTASWYGIESGNRTANGEYFDGTSLTAAMPDRKHIGERYRVTYRGKSVVVRINDTGGFAKYGRAIDLSRAAAARIGMIKAGVARVCLERLP